MGFGVNRFLIGILFLLPQGARPFGRSPCTLGGRFSPFFPFCPFFPARRYGARPKKSALPLCGELATALFLAGGRFSALSSQPFLPLRRKVARGKKPRFSGFFRGRWLKYSLSFFCDQLNYTFPYKFKLLDISHIISSLS